MNKKELEIINKTQNEYENILVSKLLDKSNYLKTICFTSQTGTGKTKMMAEVINKMNDDYYFVITSLSKGMLHKQIKAEIKKYCNRENYIVYGLNDFTSNTILTEEEILNRLPKNKKIIWFRDEGHIHTNKWYMVLENVSNKIVNFSATNIFNSNDDVVCNFNHTSMLRTLHQKNGTPEEALDCLLYVKEIHKNIKNYNPCAIFRILDDTLVPKIMRECYKRHLKCINITVDDYDMFDICKDNNEYDVIINKFKIVEGIDIRRAHVLYMTNEPSNPNTTIQLIGRCRRNALLYRNDIDIFSKENKNLLKETRICYAFYNIANMKVSQDSYGNLVSAFCNEISVQKLKPNIKINITDGYLSNGLKVLEAQEETGEFNVVVDKKTGFNVLDPKTNFYKNETASFNDVVYDNSIDAYGNLKTNTFKTKEIVENWIYLPQKNIYAEKIINSNVSFLIPKCTGDKIVEIINSTKKLKLFKKIINKINSSSFDSCLNSFINIDKKSFLRFLKEMKITKKLSEFNLKKISYKTFKYKTKKESEEVKKIFNENSQLRETDIYKMFNYIYFAINSSNCVLIDDNGSILSYGSIVSDLETSKISYIELINFLKKSKITTINKKEYYLIKKEYLKYIPNSAKTYRSHFKIPFYYNDFDYVFNNEELAIYGAEDFKIVRHNYEYKFIEERNLTSKIAKNTKFNIMISNKYKKVLENAKKFYYLDKFNLGFDKKCNSMLGYCVEYYAKHLIFDLNINENPDNYQRSHIIRKCMDEYLNMMFHAFKIDGRSITTLSESSLQDKKYDLFCKTIIKYGTQTAEFLKKYLGNKIIREVRTLPILCAEHISGLADLIVGDTIVDIKCTGCISEKYVRQIAGYHYLSLFRNDLKINKLVIYDAISKKAIEIDVNDSSVKSL